MILIAYDGSENAKHAITEAGTLFPGAEVTVMTVWHRLIETMARSGMSISVAVDYTAIDDATAERALQSAQEGADLANGGGLTATAISREAELTVGDAIRRAADELNARAIVVGTRGLGGVKSLLLGSVSHDVLQHAGRPVVVVPPPPEEDH